MQERRVSPHTIGSYRDTFRLFLKFVQERLHKAPCRRHFEDIEAPLVTAFLDHLEKQRGVSVRSRNLRLTALHSFFRYMAYELPTHSAQIQRVLAIPSKRLTRNSGPLPDAPRGRRSPCRTRSAHLDRPARSRFHADRGPNGSAALGDHRRHP